MTDNKDHFVRNHGGIPEINTDDFSLDIEGLVNEPKNLTLADLQNEALFPRQSNVVSLQCSGTRRMEQITEYPGDGDELINAPWGEGAIGTARWTGVSLKKVIKHCGGLKGGDENVHLEFYGADTYFKKGKIYNYVVSVPWRKVKVHEVLLAWEMNGEPLPKIHGFPLRAVVFGCEYFPKQLQEERERERERERKKENTKTLKIQTLAHVAANGYTKSKPSKDPVSDPSKQRNTSTTHRKSASKTPCTRTASASKTCPCRRPS
jgi:hypothetical protein